MINTGQNTEHSVSAAPPLRGWLLVVLAVLGLWCMWGLIAAVAYLPGWFQQLRTNGTGGGLDHPAVVVAGVALVALSFYTFALMLMRKQRTRPVMTVLCGLILVFVAALYIFPPHLIRGGPAILAAGALAYFARSKRVRATFVRP